MNAMRYENLIKLSHGVDRFGVAGADTDIFSRLEKSYILLTTEKELVKNGQPKRWNKTFEELQFEYGVSVGQVSAYVNTAIEKVMKDFEGRLTDEQFQTFEQCQVNLILPTYDRIISVINTATETMFNIGLSFR